MKAKEYINHLQKLIEEYGDLDLISSKDDEGNEYNPVYYAPSVGKYKDGEFNTCSKKNINAICIN